MGIPDASENPIAAHTPESGIGTIDIGLDCGLPREPPAELGPNLVDALAKHVAVWSREIHVLEDAL